MAETASTTLIKVSMGLESKQTPHYNRKAIRDLLKFCMTSFCLSSGVQGILLLHVGFLVDYLIAKSSIYVACRNFLCFVESIQIVTCWLACLDIQAMNVDSFDVDVTPAFLF